MISKEEYLKRYLSKNEANEDRKSKKIKRSKKPKGAESRFKIVEDDVEIPVATVARSKNLDGDPRNLLRNLGGDDDDDEDDEDGVKPILELVNNETEELKLFGKFQTTNWKSLDHKEEEKTAATTWRNDDASPPRRRRRFDSDDEDNGGNGAAAAADESPPRRRRHDSGDDPSPPRRRSRHDSVDQSPPRQRPRQQPSDASPPRRDRSSPPRQRVNRRGSIDPSPPRRDERRAPSIDRGRTKRVRHDSDDRSPPRRRHDSDGSAGDGGEKKDEAGRDPQQPKVIHRNIRSKKKEPTEEQKRRQEELAKKYAVWNKGAKQVQERQERLEEMVSEASKPFARHVGDEDLESHLKNIEHNDDPMLAYMREKKQKETGYVAKQSFKGPWPPNRYNIPPGYRWDGVDRSNGFEVKLMSLKNVKKAEEEEFYKWTSGTYE